MDNLNFIALHKITRVKCKVLLICFVNRYVDVLPDSSLESDNQESWSFDEIELIQYWK